jgi:hypothetical protein
MADNQLPIDPLAALLEDRLQRWERARKPQEQKLLECYQDVMRIARDDDTKGTGTAKAKKAKGLFIGSTRNKVRSARAKIKDTLFGNGQMPFDTEPTNEQLQDYADAVETILCQQLEDMRYKDTLGDGVDTLATYGTAFKFGPFVRQQSLTETNVDTSMGYPRLLESEFPYDAPYYELANTLDIYPDPNAKDEQDGLGLFWVDYKEPQEVYQWKDAKGFKNVEMAVRMVTMHMASEGSQIAEQMRGNLDYWAKDGRIKVARFFGLVPASAFSQSDGQMLQTGEQTDQVEAIVLMAGGIVIKVDKSPYKHRPVRRCVYEKVNHELWGVGIAENNAPHQKTVNAAFRLYMEGKGLALLPPMSVDRAAFLPTENFKIGPGKVFQFKPNLSAEQKKEAIQVHIIPDVTAGWEQVIEISERFSDDDTSVTKYTQGNDSPHLNSTATGVSMIMNASSLPLKEVLQNLDEMWIDHDIEDLLDWDLKYLEPETVAKLHGPKVADAWAQVKQFGKTSFMRWRATGASTFVAKEVLLNKLQGFMQVAMGNPITAPLVDARELLEQVWDAGEIGKESPVISAETLQQHQAQAQQAQQPQLPPPDPLDQMKKLVDMLPDSSPLRTVIINKALKVFGLSDEETQAAMQHELAQHALDQEEKEANIDKTKAGVIESLGMADSINTRSSLDQLETVANLIDQDTDKETGDTDIPEQQPEQPEPNEAPETQPDSEGAGDIHLHIHQPDLTQEPMSGPQDAGE